MVWRWLADVVLLLHLAFILFAVFGALLLWRWPRLVRLHLPAVAWAAAIEFLGGICPLTPLENSLRRSGGGDAYDGSCIGHYLLPLIYPDGLTRDLQFGLGAFVVGLNLAAYAAWWRHRRRRRAE